MGRAKQFEIEVRYEEINELNELKEMDLEKVISELEKQLEYAKADLDEDAADDLSNQLMSSKELLERMSYLQETYPTNNENDEDVQHNDYQDANEDEAIEEVVKDDKKDLKW